MIDEAMLSDQTGEDRHIKSALDLSIVIPTRGQRSSLKTCLESIALQNLNGYKLEVLVCFNGAKLPDWLSEYLRQLSTFSCRLVHAPQNSIVSARNMGIQQSHGAIIYLIDDDCYLPHSDFLLQLFYFHEQSREVTVLGGSFDSCSESSFWGRCYNLMTHMWVEVHVGVDGDTVCLPGGNISIKSSLLPRLVLFSQARPCGGEESWFLGQVVEQGGQVRYHSGLSVRHCSKHGLRDFIQRAIQHGKAKARNQVGESEHRRSERKRPFTFSILRHSLSPYGVFVGLFLVLMQLTFAWECLRLRVLGLKVEPKV